MPVPGFRQRVRAEHWPNRLRWGLRDAFALLMLPLMLLLPACLSALFPLSPAFLINGDVVLRAVLFLALIVLYQDMLAHHWQHFKAGGWRSWALVFSGAIGLQLCISIVKTYLPATAVLGAAEPDIDLPSLGLMLLLGFGPVLTALIEDIVFRYTLLHKLFTPHRLWRVAVLLGNSVLFGLLHYHNVGGHLLATISFMAAGLYLNLIYVWTRNLWHVLLIHVLNNAALSLGGVVLLMVLQALGLGAGM